LERRSDKRVGSRRYRNSGRWPGLRVDTRAACPISDARARAEPDGAAFLPCRWDTAPVQFVSDAAQSRYAIGLNALDDRRKVGRKPSRPRCTDLVSAVAMRPRWRFVGRQRLGQNFERELTGFTLRLADDSRAAAKSDALRTLNPNQAGQRSDDCGQLVKAF
jgi:hypothetical protein